MTALTTSKGDVITLPGLDGAPELPAAGSPASGPVSETARRFTKSISKEQVVAAMQRCAGNATQAAKALGIGRTAMHELMTRYGIKRNETE